MKVGYSVEGSTDRAFLKGLRNRWCPGVELIEGQFRGRSGQSQRREIRKTCTELISKGADLIIFMRDANDENWREVMKEDRNRCESSRCHIAVFAVCDRNIECWLCADRDWIAKRCGRTSAEFAVSDPKGVFESALEISTFDRKEDDIASIVCEAPLNNWLRNRSFEVLYDALWQKSKWFACKIENLKERQKKNGQ